MEGNRGMLLEDHSESYLVRRTTPRHYCLCRGRKMSVWHTSPLLVHAALFLYMSKVFFTRVPIKASETLTHWLLS